MGEMKEVRCPKCGGAIRFEFRATLSADREPEAAEVLRRGTLFDVRCGCGFESTIRYPMLYTDMAHRAVIRCTGTDDEEVLRMTAEEVRKTAEAFGGAALQHRIVTDADDLREKAEIFHAGLDDRHVEIMKPFVLQQLREAKPDLPVAYLRFHEADGGDVFTAYDAGGSPLGSFPFNRRAYEEGIVPNMPLGPEDEVLFVSAAWTADYFSRRAG